MASPKYNLRLSEELDQAVRESVPPTRGFSESVRALLEVAVKARRHPGVYFLDNSRGEPVARIAGAKIWVLIDLYLVRRAAGLEHEQAIAAVVKETELDESSLQRALLYYADYQDEIDQKIEHSQLVANQAVEQMAALNRIAA